MTNVLLWIGAILDVLFLGVLLLTPRVSAPQYRYGVLLPAPARGDPALAAADHAYRIGIGFAAVAGVPFLAVGATAGWAWMALVAPFVVLAVAFAGYFVARREVLRVKASGAWPSPGPRVAVAEWVPAEVDHTWPAWLLLPIVVWVAFLAWGIVLYPGLPASLPTHFNNNGVADAYSPKSVGTAFYGQFIGLAVLAVFALLAAAITRARAPLDPARPRTDAARQFQFRAQGVRALLAFGAFLQVTIGLSSALTWNAISGTAAGGLLVIIPTFVGVVIVLAVILRLGQLGSRIPMPPEPEGPPIAPAGARQPRDDDASWAGGVLYVNRQDSALLIPRRFGVGWTLNWGNPWSWVIIGALVAVPFILLLAARA